VVLTEETDIGVRKNEKGKRQKIRYDAQTSIASLSPFY
jgi:hypothetical protein